MMAFLDPNHGLPTDNPMFNVYTSDGLIFWMAKPAVYVANDGRRIVFPVLGGSDGASAPSVLASLGFTHYGRWWCAAVGHDLLYRDVATDQFGQKLRLPKDDCDLLFKEMMIATKVPDEKVAELYEAVHLFGQSAFDEDRGVA
jgi:hypothetical protein